MAGKSQYRTKQKSATYWSENPKDLSWSNGFYWRYGPFERTNLNAVTERIDYTLDGDHRAFNICSHTVTRQPTEWPIGRSLRCPDSRIGWPDGSFPHNESYAPQSFTPGAFYCGVRPVAVSSKDMTADLSRKAYDSYLDCMALAPGHSMNLVRSAIELKDTKQTIGGLASFASWGKKFLKKTGRPAALVSLYEIASAYLTYQFGIAPTVSDVKSFIGQMSSGQLIVRGHPRIIGKGAVVESHYGLTAHSGDFLSLQGSTHCHQTVWQDWIGTNGVFYVPYRQNVPSCPYSGSLRRVLAKEARGVVFARATKTMVVDGVDKLSRRFEWSCPIAKTLWDLTPFSFLLDWFVDVGSSIERMAKLELLAEYKSALTAVWHGCQIGYTAYDPLVRCEVSSKVVSHTPGTRMWTVEYRNRSDIIGKIKVKSSYDYDRKPYLVPSNALLPPIRWKLNAYQLSTGMSLLITTARSLRSR